MKSATLAYLFFWLCSAWALPGRAQTGFAWQRGYGTAARNERGGLAVEVPGPTGGFLLAGQQLLPPNNANARIFLVRTNSQGDTLWTRFLTPPLSVQPHPTGLALDAGGNVLLTVSGGYANPPGIGYAIKLNPACDAVLWQNFYQPVVGPGTFGSSSISNPCVAPDGNYVFLQADNYVSGSQPNSRLSLLKVNAGTGAQIWRFDVSQYAVAAGYSPNIFTVSSFTPYTGGIMLYLDLYNPANLTGTEEYVFVSDAGTLARFKRRVITSSPPDNLPVFKTLRDGNALVGRRQKLYKISTAPATAGDTLWRTVAPRASTGRDWDARDMAEDQNGDILLVGDSYLEVPGNLPTSRQIHLVRFSGSGVLQRDTILRRPGDNFARSVFVGPTGHDFIFSGYATQGIIGGEDLLMARYTGLRPLATVPGAATSSLRPHLQLHPNPAGGSALVQAALPDRRGGTLLVLDALGRQVARQAVGAGAAAAAVPVAGLPPGVYVLRYAPAGGGPPATARLLRE